MDYRLYFLDAAERINGILTFDCNNEELAISTAQQRAGNRPYQLWSRNRLVDASGRPPLNNWIGLIAR